MIGSNLMYGRGAPVESLAIIGLIPTAVALTLGILKPADAAKHVGAMLGIVVAFILIPMVLGKPTSVWVRGA